MKVFKAFDSAAAPPADRRRDGRAGEGQATAAACRRSQAGAAEVLYGLGAALGRRGGEDLGLVYLQLALYLSPNHPLALLSLADLYEQVKNPQLAIKVYERVPQTSPLRRNAEIQLAINLDSVDRPTRPSSDCRTCSRSIPRISTRSWRSAASCAAARNSPNAREVYSKGVATIANPERPNWLIFYFRGICNERAKNWPG